MSQQASAHCDLIGLVSYDEHGDYVMFIKANRGTTDHVMKEMPVGTSITFESVEHPSFGKLVIPVIRRGRHPLNVRTIRTLLQE